jgi:murein DD-endopeptidase MepM/ murein hydrolase activator NlpD
MRRSLFLFALVAMVLTPTARAWTWPTEGPVLRFFEFGSDPYASGLHRGIDVAGDRGTTVRAASEGTVSFAGTVPHGGKTVTVQTADGYSVTLVHLGSIGVLQGTIVDQGDAVGTIGPSGEPEVAEPYVHLGIRVTDEPQGYVDPLTRRNADDKRAEELHGPDDS